MHWADSKIDQWNVEMLFIWVAVTAISDWGWCFFLSQVCLFNWFWVTYLLWRGNCLFRLVMLVMKNRSSIIHHWQEIDYFILTWILRFSLHKKKKIKWDKLSDILFDCQPFPVVLISYSTLPITQHRGKVQMLKMMVAS